MDKKAILTDIVNDLERKLRESHQATSEVFDAAVEQEGRNQTRYDTMRVEGSWLADGMKLRLSELQRELQLARTYAFPPSTPAATLGSLVMMGSNGSSQAYLILPFGGGFEGKVGDTKYCVVQPHAPIARALLGKTSGSEVYVGKTRVTLTEVL